MERCIACSRAYAPVKDELLLCSQYCRCGYDVSQSEDIELNANSYRVCETLTQNTLLLMERLQNPLTWSDYKQLMLDSHLKRYQRIHRSYKKLETELFNEYGEELLRYFLIGIDIPKDWLNQVIKHQDKPIDPVFQHLLVHNFMGSINSWLLDNEQAA